MGEWQPVSRGIATGDVDALPGAWSVRGGVGPGAPRGHTVRAEPVRRPASATEAKGGTLAAEETPRGRSSAIDGPDKRREAPRHSRTNRKQMSHSASEPLRQSRAAALPHNVHGRTRFRTWRSMTSSQRVLTAAGRDASRSPSPSSSPPRSADLATYRLTMRRIESIRSVTQPGRKANKRAGSAVRRSGRDSEETWAGRDGLNNGRPSAKQIDGMRSRGSHRGSGRSGEQRQRPSCASQQPTLWSADLVSREAPRHLRSRVRLAKLDAPQSSEERLSSMDAATRKQMLDEYRSFTLRKRMRLKAEMLLQDIATREAAAAAEAARRMWVAAVQIEALARGHLARRRVSAIVQIKMEQARREAARQFTASTAVQAVWRGWLARKRMYNEFGFRHTGKSRQGLQQRRRPRGASLSSDSDEIITREDDRQHDGLGTGRHWSTSLVLSVGSDAEDPVYRKAQQHVMPAGPRGWASEPRQPRSTHHAHARDRRRRSISEGIVGDASPRATSSTLAEPEAHSVGTRSVQGSTTSGSPRTPRSHGSARDDTGAPRQGTAGGDAHYAHPGVAAHRDGRTRVVSSGDDNSARWDDITGSGSANSRLSAADSQHVRARSADSANAFDEGVRATRAASPRSLMVSPKSVRSTQSRTSGRWSRTSPRAWAQTSPRNTGASFDVVSPPSNTDGRADAQPRASASGDAARDSGLDAAALAATARSPSNMSVKTEGAQASTGKSPVHPHKSRSKSETFGSAASPSSPTRRGLASRIRAKLPTMRRSPTRKASSTSAASTPQARAREDEHGASTETRSVASEGADHEERHAKASSLRHTNSEGESKPVRRFVKLRSALSSMSSRARGASEPVEGQVSAEASAKPASVAVVARVASAEMPLPAGPLPGGELDDGGRSQPSAGGDAGSGSADADAEPDTRRTSTAAVPADASHSDVAGSDASGEFNAYSQETTAASDKPSVTEETSGAVVSGTGAAATATDTPGNGERLAATRIQATGRGYLVRRSVPATTAGKPTSGSDMPQPPAEAVPPGVGTMPPKRTRSSGDSSLLKAALKNSAVHRAGSGKQTEDERTRHERAESGESVERVPALVGDPVGPGAVQRIVEDGAPPWPAAPSLIPRAGTRMPLSAARVLSEVNRTGALRVHTATWCLSGVRASFDNLSQLLPPQQHHVYAIGAQSVVEAEVWEAAITKALGASYTLVGATSSRENVYIHVFVHRALRSLVSGVQRGHVNLPGGRAGVGAAGVSLSIGRTSFAFLTCTLAGGTDEVEARNAESEEIDFELLLMPTTVERPPEGKATADYLRSVRGRRRLTERFDRLFWFGAMNYSIGGTAMDIEVLLERNDSSALLELDQLRTVMADAAVDAFSTLAEGPLVFLPTAKFLLNAHRYDARCPQSWADRVLFSPTGVDLLHYDAVYGLAVSDRRPVTAVFLCTVDPSRDETLEGGTPQLSLAQVAKLKGKARSVRAEKSGACVVQ